MGNGRFANHEERRTNGGSGSGADIYQLLRMKKLLAHKRMAVPGLDAETNAKLEGELMLHQAKGERGYQALKEDTALAKSDPTIAFDLQQTLPTPSLSTEGSYGHTIMVYTSCIQVLDACICGVKTLQAGDLMKWARAF